MKRSPYQMEAVMGVLITIGVLVAIGVFCAWFLKRQAQARKQKYDTAARADAASTTSSTRGTDPRELKRGDLVDVFGDNCVYEVLGVVTLTEGPDTWREFLVETATGDRAYLSVEKVKRDIETTLWTDILDSGLEPNSKTIGYRDFVYTRVESGRANYGSEGDTELLSSGSVEYVDYKCVGNGQYLSFERFDGGKWEVSSGRVVAKGFLTIYPRAV